MDGGGGGTPRLEYSTGSQGHTMLSMAWNDIQGSVIVLLMNRAELLLLVRVGR